ncbi:MAG: two-component system response regulator AtoC [Desulforhopalus sp.]|jgi:two-component system response regulator AtoC
MKLESIATIKHQDHLRENMYTVSVFEAKNNGQDFVLKTYNKTQTTELYGDSGLFVGRSILSMAQEDQRDHVFHAFQRVWRTGIPAHHQPPGYKEEKPGRFFEKFIYRLSNGDIAVIYSNRPVHAVFKNMLKITKEFLSLIAHSFEGFNFTIANDYKITDINQSLREHSPHDIIGKNCFTVIHGLDSPCSWCIREKVLAGNPASFEIQSPKNNRWYCYVISPSVDITGKISAQQVIAIDINDRKITEERLLQEKNVAQSVTIKRYGLDKIVGQSRQILEIFAIIKNVAALDISVLICGESGTGKELVARAIHNLGKRKNNVFLPVNCGGIPENLVESEFFGYKKGAFSCANTDKAGFLEIADRGTLFLDEVGEIDSKMQVKLLRSLNGDGYTPLGSNLPVKTNLRIICATNENVQNLLKTGRLRPDFFYRINVVLIKLPPLRERRDDISLLANHFFKKLKTDGSSAHLPSHVVQALLEYDWPGNVRELQNVIYRYVALNRLDFAESYSAGESEKEESSVGECIGESPSISLRELMEEYERKTIIHHLEKNQWQRGKVATILKISRKTLYKKITKLGISNNP